MTTNLDTRLNTISPAVISLFRIVFGLLYTIHGAQKLFAWPVGMPDKAGNLVGSAVPVGTWPYWYGGLIEFVLGLLILTGLFTRIAAFFAAGEMAFAYFTQHQPKALLPIENGGELAVLYCFGFFLLVFIGGGAYALDAVRRRR
ncbi:phosphoribosylaminoimidazolecarboxamide formyltransferase [Mycobacterium dioxanotrophicus]|jgi:putative oxidoreductase|uniref:Phosphoribosylaminoimidazolecarboxamide formyltransferase n=1 Tax=Mycobacterium dioxanotrophicus TaxID=482462 RepID=A0A1Y0C2L1_9MYCO|nr:DoxX family protein [Mycobacterium dioxanotrophicus]ART69430.1 phosphoribosylaminoimidazolecarboxamide formyltransferase [Mycobacterium dioxanotrophicus]